MKHKYVEAEITAEDPKMRKKIKRLLEEMEIYKLIYYEDRPLKWNELRKKSESHNQKFQRILNRLIEKGMVIKNKEGEYETKGVVIDKEGSIRNLFLS